MCLGKDGVGALGSRHSRRLVKKTSLSLCVFFLQWKVFPASFMFHGPVGFSNFSERIIISPPPLTRPEEAFRRRTAVTLACLLSSESLDRGGADVTSPDRRCCSPQPARPRLFLTTAHVCNKEAISADIPPAGVKRGQRSDLRRAAAARSEP